VYATLLSSRTPPFMMVLEVSHHPFPGGQARVHGETMVELCCYPIFGVRTQKKKEKRKYKK